MNRDPEDYIHGPGVFVPELVAAFLGTIITPELRRAQREENPEIYRVLIALRQVALNRGMLGSSAPSSAFARKAEQAEDLETQGITVRSAATKLGITERGVRQAISRNRLPASRSTGRWLITETDLNDFSQQRAA